MVRKVVEIAGQKAECVVHPEISDGHIIQAEGITMGTIQRAEAVVGHIGDSRADAAPEEGLIVDEFAALSAHVWILYGAIGHAFVYYIDTAIGSEFCSVETAPGDVVRVIIITAVYYVNGIYS